MKTFFLSIAMLIACCTFAQQNNPYNQRGIDYMKSFNLIKTDYQAGKIKELNEATLDYYSKAVPLQNSISMELASDIIKAFKNQPIDADQVVKETNLSDYSKKTLLEFIKNTKGLHDEDLKSFYVKKNDEISGSKISTEEKEFLLTLSAINYNALDRNANIVGRAFGEDDDGGCAVQGGGATTSISNGECILLAASIGAAIGWRICGGWCAAGGAVLFGVLTAIVLS